MGMTIEQQRAKLRRIKEREAKNNRPRKRKIRHQIKGNGHVKTRHILVRGIYFLYHDQEIVYIGQSKTNVMQRICGHHAEGTKVFNSFSFLPYTSYSDKKLSFKEEILIKKYNPKYNIVHKKNMLKSKHLNPLDN